MSKHSQGSIGIRSNRSETQPEIRQTNRVNAVVDTHSTGRIIGHEDESLGPAMNQ